MRVELRTTTRGCEITVARDIDDAVYGRLKALADAEGRTLEESIRARNSGLDGLEDVLDVVIEEFTEPYFAKWSPIEFAQQLFCHSVSLEWACPWNCDHLEQSEDEFRLHVREWWGYARATAGQRAYLDAAAEAALKHDGAECRRLVRLVVDTWPPLADGVE